MSVKEFLTTLIVGILKNGLAIGWTVLVSAYPSIAKVLAPINNELVSQVVATGIGVVIVSLAGTLYRRALHNKAVAEAFDAGAEAMKHAVDVSTGAASSLGDPALWNPSRRKPGSELPCPHSKATW